MDWNIVVTERYQEWFLSLDHKQQVAVHALVMVLKSIGPQLGRPYADTLSSYRKVRFKELRVQASGQPLRVFYKFDEDATCVLLCGGNKKGPKDKSFYRRMLETAENEYIAYLAWKTGNTQHD